MLHLAPPQWIIPVKFSRENFSRWISSLWVITISPQFFSINFFRKLTTGTSSLLINLIVYVIIITRKIRKGINENTLPNVESYFECCRTWTNAFWIFMSLSFLHNVYVFYCLYYDFII